MPATMDKSDVLYRVPYKTRESIKWGTIQKLNHGKGAPNSVKNDIFALLSDKKNNKMELKVGKIGKGSNCKLVLRVKNGSAHLFEHVLSKGYTDASEEEKGQYGNDQKEAAQKANKEMDDVFNQTAAAMKKYKDVKDKFDKIKTQYESMRKTLNSNPSKDVASKIVSQFKVWKNVLTRYGPEVDKIYKVHQQEAQDFRSKGAGAITNKYNVDDEHARPIKKRFMDHSKVYKEFESKCNAFAVKSAELTTNLDADVKLAEGKVNVYGAALEMLAKTQKEFEQVINAANTSMSFGSLENYKETTVLASTYVDLDAKIKAAATRRDAIAKVKKRVEKLYSARIDKLESSAKLLPEVAKEQKTIDDMLKGFYDDVAKFTKLANDAISHYETVMKELEEQS